VDGRLVAIVDVLTLTYATLERMNAMSGEQTKETEGGPMWGRFFESIGGEDSESIMSGSRAHPDHPSFSVGHLSQLQQSPRSEVHPNDSASLVDDEPPAVLDGYRQRRSATQLTSSLPVDDGTYVFKFRTPSGRTHRFQARQDDVGNLREIVSGKLAADPFFTGYQPADDNDVPPDPLDFLLSYTDADGDTVVITSDHDVSDAVKIARESGSDRVVLFVQGGKGWAEITDGNGIKAAELAPEPKDAENSDNLAPDAVSPSPPLYAPYTRQDDVFGIPKDLLLPASIGALAVVIIGVFTISRLTSSHY